MHVEFTETDIEAAKIMGASPYALGAAVIHSALDREGVSRDGRYVNVTEHEIHIQLPGDELHVIPLHRELPDDPDDYATV